MINTVTTNSAHICSRHITTCTGSILRNLLKVYGRKGTVNGRRALDQVPLTDTPLHFSLKSRSSARNTTHGHVAVVTSRRGDDNFEFTSIVAGAADTEEDEEDEEEADEDVVIVDDEPNRVRRAIDTAEGVVATYLTGTGTGTNDQTISSSGQPEGLEDLSSHVYGLQHIDPTAHGHGLMHPLFVDLVLNCKELLTKKKLESGGAETLVQNSSDPNVRVAFASRLDSATQRVQNLQVWSDLLFAQ